MGVLKRATRTIELVSFGTKVFGSPQITMKRWYLSIGYNINYPKNGFKTDTLVLIVIIWECICPRFSFIILNYFAFVNIMGFTSIIAREKVILYHLFNLNVKRDMNHVHLIFKWNVYGAKSSLQRFSHLSNILFTWSSDRGLYFINWNETECHGIKVN